MCGRRYNFHPVMHVRAPSTTTTTSTPVYTIVNLPYLLFLYTCDAVLSRSVNKRVTHELSMSTARARPLKSARERGGRIFLTTRDELTQRTKEGEE